MLIYFFSSTTKQFEATFEDCPHACILPVQATQDGKMRITIPRLVIPMQAVHIAAHLPSALADEVAEVLAKSKTTRIERIVSHGQSSPTGFWYDQGQSEWVYLVQGKAAIRFEVNDELVHLDEGMYIDIPAHARHRVEWTSRDMPTVWLAVFY